MRQQSFKIEWQASEYEHKERSSDWFWAVGIIAFAIAIVSIIFGNIIFGVLVLIRAFSLAIFANRPPNILDVTVDERGITRDKVQYPYSSLESFWIDIEHPHKKIILRSNKMLMPLIIIPISDEVDIDNLHDKLSLFLKEEFHSLPLIERLLEYLGF